MPHLQGVRRRQHFVNKLVMHGIMDNDPRRGGTFLAGAAIGSVDRAGNGKIDIGIIHHGKGIL